MENLDLEAVEQLAKAVRPEENLVKWARLMNLKGVVLCNLNRYEEAAKTFLDALKVSDAVLKSKIYINFSKVFFFTKNTNRALDLVSKVFELSKTDRKFPPELLGYAHMLRGQIYNLVKDEKLSLAEFRKAEYFFEVGANPRGVGLACLEIARIFIKRQDMNTAWNFLKKSELFLNKVGAEEKLGVYICKAVALYYSGKGDEAIRLLDELYEEKAELGKGTNTIDEIIDAYLDTRTRMVQYQTALM
jgi:tetratricopeptide (TPR) repeat protein